HHHAPRPAAQPRLVSCDGRRAQLRLPRADECAADGTLRHRKRIRRAARRRDQGPQRADLQGARHGRRVTDDLDIRTVPIQVKRSARLAMLGPEGPGVREIWYVLHGYAQLAAPFLEGLRAIDDGTRLIVAPEALSRFYEGDTQARLHRDARVGASWMTREDRESEIADYIAYLDTVHQSILTRLGVEDHAPEVT